MMRLNYQFSNLCGCAYRDGNIIFTADGTSLLSPVGNRVTVFDLANHTSQTLRFQQRHNIKCIALSPNNKLLVSIDSEGHAVILNFRKQIVLATMKFKSRNITALKFSPDSQYLAVAHDNWITVWKSPSLIVEWKPMLLHGKYRGHYADITCLAWSDDSQFLVSGSKDMTAKIHALHKRKPFKSQTLSGHQGEVIAAFFGTDCRLYTLTKSGYVYQWIAGAKRELHDRYKERYPLLMYASYTANGKYYLYVKGKPDSIINCATFFKSATCDLLVIGQCNGVFALYKMPNFALLHSLSISTRTITTCAMNSGGDWIAFASRDLGQLMVWEWRSETFILKQQGHFYDVNSIAYSSDGQLIATGGHDGKLKIWNAKNGFCFITFHDHSAPITKVAFARKNSTIVVSASLDGTVRVYDLVRYVNFRTLTPPNKDDYQRFLNHLLQDLKISGNGAGGAGAGAGAGGPGEAERQRERQQMIEHKLNSGIPQQTARFVSLALDDSGELIMAGCEDPFEIYVWSLRSGKCLDILYGHEGPVSSLAFSNAANLLVSGSWDQTIRLWDVYSSATTEIIETQSEVLDVAARFDGKEICCCTLNGQLQMYDPMHGTHLNTMDIRMDVMGGKNKQTDFFKAEKNAKINHFTTVCYSPNGKCLIAGGNSKYICMYYLPQSLLLRRYVSTNNKDLEGVLENPNMDKLEHDLNRSEAERNRDVIKLQRKQLPGVELTDFSSRRRKRAISTKSVRFSPTGLMWAAATTDGLLVYSQSDRVIFDPIDLDMDITPQTIMREVKSEHFAKALIMSIKLNQKSLLQEVIERVPVSEIAICVQALSPRYFESMFYALSANIERTQYLQFYLMWINKLCTIHGQYLRANWTNFLPHFRLIQKALTTLYNDISPICSANIDRLAFLSSFGGAEERKSIKFDDKESETNRQSAPNGEFKPIPFKPLPDDNECMN